MAAFFGPGSVLVQAGRWVEICWAAELRKFLLIGNKQNHFTSIYSGYLSQRSS